MKVMVTIHFHCTEKKHLDYSAINNLFKVGVDLL